MVFRGFNHTKTPMARFAPRVTTASLLALLAIAAAGPIVVSAHAQEECHIRKLVDEHEHRAPQHRAEPLRRVAGGGPGLLEHALEPVERFAEREREQLLLRIEVVVQRRLREAQA